MLDSWWFIENSQYYFQNVSISFWCWIEMVNVQVRLFYFLSMEENKITNQRLQQKMNRTTNVGYIKRLFFLLKICFRQSPHYVRNDKKGCFLKTSVFPFDVWGVITLSLFPFFYLLAQTSLFPFEVFNQIVNPKS